MEFYNKNKCGADVADQMVGQYSVKAGTRRWPVAVFYNIVEHNVFVFHKKRTGEKVSRQGFLFKLGAELSEDYIVERSNRNATIARPHSLSTDSTKNKAEKRKKCQIAANCTQNKTSKLCFKCNIIVCVPPRSFPNAFYVRQRKYETFSNFVSSFCTSLQTKLFFVDRLIDLHDLSICSTLKLQPHHAYTSETVFRRSGQNDRCWPLKAYGNFGRSSVQLFLFRNKTNSYKKKG